MKYLGICLPNIPFMNTPRPTNLPYLLSLSLEKESFWPNWWGPWGLSPWIQMALKSPELILKKLSTPKDDPTADCRNVRPKGPTWGKIKLKNNTKLVSAGFQCIKLKILFNQKQTKRRKSWKILKYLFS